MVTVVEAVTAREVTVKVALVPPAGMVTLAGTVAIDVLLLVRVMRAPPASAGALSATLPVEVDPPWILIGCRVSDVRVGPA
jgi:hypothetical protein